MSPSPEIRVYGGEIVSSSVNNIVLPAVDNIVFAVPASTKEDYEREGRALATFYAELLGMRFLREGWFMIAKDEQSEPRLAFGDGPIDDYKAPRWPDPDHPQQLHLDLPASDLDAADDLAVRLGANRLQDEGDYRTYADPVGHPFCLYRDAADEDPDGHPLTGRIGRVVVDCFSPRSLAAFYAELLEMPTRELDTPELVVIARADGRPPALAFQHAVFPAPRWPDADFPQQVHLDIWVEHSETARELALRLGAIPLPAIGGSCPVFADPAGHPFCLCTAGQ